MATSPIVNSGRSFTPYVIRGGKAGSAFAFTRPAPLPPDDRFNLGTACVIDRQPRALSPAEAETLNRLTCINAY